jgi:hypothetical protein
MHVVDIKPGWRRGVPHLGGYSERIANRRPVVPQRQLDGAVQKHVAPYSDDRERRYDIELGCWVVITPAQPQPRQEPPRPSARPRQLGGPLWEVWDRHGVRLRWSFTAPSFDVARDEKERLALATGERPGWYRVRRAPASYR